MVEIAPSEQPSKSRSLFHYTTAAGLLGILENRSLFATHADFLNDSSECTLILPYLERILATEYERLIPKLIDLKVMNQELLREHGRAIFEMEAKNSVGVMLKAVNSIAPYFIASFCIHAETEYAYSHGLLSQWRSYALGGFAIEFDELKIDALNKDEAAGWTYQGIITDTVAYENHEDRVKPDQFRGMAGAFLRNIISADRLSAAFLKNELAHVLGKSDVDDFAHPFLSVAPFLKHNGFKEESEYRIVAMCNRPTQREPSEKRDVKQIRFRSRPDGNVVPYIALYDGLKKHLPIKSVIVGPHAQQKNQRLAVELLLEKHNVNAPVRTSELPFRE